MAYTLTIEPDYTLIEGNSRKWVSKQPLTAVLHGNEITLRAKKRIFGKFQHTEIVEGNTVDTSAMDAEGVYAEIFAGIQGTPTYTAEYNAILNLATAQGFALPSDPTKTAHNAFIVALKAAGLWAEFDLLNIYYGDMAQDFGRINWVNPVAGALATLVSAPTYTNKRGFNSAGGGSYIDTEYDTSTGTNYTQNDAAAGFFGYNDVSSNRIFGGGNLIVSAKSSGTTFLAVNGPNTTSIPVSTNDGLIGGVRKAINDLEMNVILRDDSGALAHIKSRVR